MQPLIAQVSPGCADAEAGNVARAHGQVHRPAGNRNIFINHQHRAVGDRCAARAADNDAVSIRVDCAHIG